MDIHVLWISIFNYPCFYGYPFGYPWISMDIHVLTCHGFSIQGLEESDTVPFKPNGFPKCPGRVIPAYVFVARFIDETSAKDRVRQLYLKLLNSISFIYYPKSSPAQVIQLTLKTNS